VDPTRLELVTSAMRRLSVLSNTIGKPFPTNVIPEPTTDKLSDKLVVSTLGSRKSRSWLRAHLKYFNP
jgi:hypothetical protein